MRLSFRLNGKQVETDVRPDMLLLDLVRDLGCYSVKRGCETANCGLCTVWLDGKPVLSCSTLAIRADGRHVTTLEGLQKEAEELLELCHRYGVLLILDDDVELAAKVGADGVHIGQSDMELAHARAILGPDKIIGVTAKTVEQAKAAEAGGADYLGSGAVFGSATKKDAIPMKHELLEEICHSVKIPVVAIGGITAENVLQLKGRGMAGIAVVSGIFAF